MDDEFVVLVAVRIDPLADGHITHELQLAAVVHLDEVVRSSGIGVIAGNGRGGLQLRYNPATARVRREIPRVDAEVLDVGQLRGVQYYFAVAPDIEDIEVLQRTAHYGVVGGLLRVVPDPKLAVTVVTVDVVGQGDHAVCGA